MKIAFRVDASDMIGTGHIMRCLNLADTLKTKNAECLFLCNEDAGEIFDCIEQRGHKATALPATGSSQAGLGDVAQEKNEVSTGFDLSVDAHHSGKIIAQYQPEWLVVDHYRIDADWEAELNPVCGRMLVIDDLANRNHDCHMLVDANFGRTPEEYRPFVPAACKLLVGPEFIMLHPMCYASSVRHRRGTVVFLGGGDNQADLRKVIPMLPIYDLPQPVTVILGSNQPRKADLIRQCNDYGLQHTVNPADFKERCRAASLAIVRCGLVSYELAAFKTPSICLWRPGIHKKVAMCLEQEGFVVATTLENFINPKAGLMDVQKAIDLKPDSQFQTGPGQDIILRYMVA